TGPGISSELQEEVFAPFFTTKPEGEGTGLGLYICQNIIREHGGTIALESQLGEGTLFRISFPVE
ncbi:MAG: ATP-binding protein, partial [Desulfuromonadales bacterium]|nr:ATP-binding protein [Desulfuromonadales bacterium]